MKRQLPICAECGTTTPAHPDSWLILKMPKAKAEEHLCSRECLLKHMDAMNANQPPRRRTP